MIFKKMKLWGFLACLAFTVSACSDSQDFEYTGNNDRNEGKYEVTISVQLEKQSRGVRSNVSLPYFGNGEKIDVLKFAVYVVNKDESGNEIYSIAPEFQNANNVSSIGQVNVGKGQNLFNMASSIWPLQLKFSLDPEKTYRFAFWAQSSETEAFNTDNLQAVKVNYSKKVGSSTGYFQNNDDLRDAFCANSGNIRASSEKSTYQIILHRPFAQINVGTSGWDYEGEASQEPKPAMFALSEVELTGVAQYYNVLKGTDGKGDLPTDEELEAMGIKEKVMLSQPVKFNMSRMPAFVNIPSEEWDYLIYMPYNKAYFETCKAKTEEDAKNAYKNAFKKYYDGQTIGSLGKISSEWELPKNWEPSDKEEFLKINLDNNLEINPYMGWFDGIPNSWFESSQEGEPDNSSSEKLRNETFKYLSMCYVLPKGNIDKLVLTLENKEQQTGFGEALTIRNVPALRNWRTNIIAESLFFISVHFYLDIVGTYCGDYLNTYDEWPEGYFKKKDDEYVKNEDGTYEWIGKGSQNSGFDHPNY